MMSGGERREASHSSGFTLIELMVAIALLAILISLAVPSFTSMIKRNRVDAAASSLAVGLATARSEAVKRGVNVSICKSSDGSTCATSGDWSTGWVIYVTAGTPIKVFDAAGSSVTMVGDNNVQSAIIFSPTGQTTLTADGNITVCIAGVTAKVVTVSASGRARVNGGATCS